jgi:hypothetical protein
MAAILARRRGSPPQRCNVNGMEFSWGAWLVSVAVVLASGAVAAHEGHWRRRPGLDMGFADHGGMWGDALLLPIANALAVPSIAPGWWLLAPLAAGAAISWRLHIVWHGGATGGVRDHMWPARPTGRWAADLSRSGWCHVLYVAGEMGLLLAWAWSPSPAVAVWTVTTILSLHAPLGVLQPSWFATGRLLGAGVRLVILALGAAWLIAALKL